MKLPMRGGGVSAVTDAAAVQTDNACAPADGTPLQATCEAQATDWG